MREPVDSSGSTWPDGTPRSQGNAFTGFGQIQRPKQPPPPYKKNGLVKPKNNGFAIPSRLQAQAAADRRHAIRKGGI